MAISDARDAVRDLKSARGDGEDPQAIRQRSVVAKVAETAHETYTVRALIDHYVTEHLDKTKRGGERERMLRQDLKKWYGREVATVSRKDVKELVAKIAKRAPDTAGRILRELRAAYRHALDHERIAVSVDPTTGVRAPKESRYVPRDRAFTIGEWKAWFKWLPKSGVSQDVQDALRLIALTAARPGEVTAAKWADIDLENGTWAIRARKREGSHSFSYPAQRSPSSRGVHATATMCFPHRRVETIPFDNAPGVGDCQFAGSLPRARLDGT